MATTQTQTSQSSSQTQPQLPQQPQSQSQAEPQLTPQPKSDAGNQTISHQMKSVPHEMKSPTVQSKSVSVGVEAKQLSPQVPVKSQAMVAPTTKIIPTTTASTIGISIATVSASPITTTVSTAPVVSSTSIQDTASVGTVMTSIETSTSPPPPSNIIENINSTVEAITNSVTVLEPHEEKIVSYEAPKLPEKVENETVVPQSVVKPSLAPVKDKQPQKAIVKPQVLTHVIDGFVIQEGSEPFPVIFLKMFISFSMHFFILKYEFLNSNVSGICL